jgi:hypothetical protein
VVSAARDRSTYQRREGHQLLVVIKASREIKTQRDSVIESNHIVSIRQGMRNVEIKLIDGSRHQVSDPLNVVLEKLGYDEKQFIFTQSANPEM